MKKQFFVAIVLVLAISIADAQSKITPKGKQGGAPGMNYSGNFTGVLNYIPNYDVMGAHENGGRGCTSCHAIHNDAHIRDNGAAAVDAQQMWGTDTGAILSYYGPSGILFDGRNSRHSGQLTLSGADAWSNPIYTGVVTCLSCHDGEYSTGAMMSGQAYEQVFGLLDNVAMRTLLNSSSGRSVALYGDNPIPTFLGATAMSPNGYASTHPVGQSANMKAVLREVLVNPAYGLAPAITGDTFVPSKIANDTPFGNFTASYYPGALAGTVSQETGSFGDHFVVCTTCHNQHNMSVYGGGQRNEFVPEGVTQVRTIFFVNGGYNPSAPYDTTHIPSATRFCQQCHFALSTEYYGAANIGTAY